jgi:hypothetical protein
MGYWEGFFPKDITDLCGKRPVLFQTSFPLTILSAIVYIIFPLKYTLTGSKKKTVEKYLKYRNIIDIGLLCRHLDINYKKEKTRPDVSFTA